MNDLFIQELKNRAGLSSVISRYIRLTYKNGHYMGCCPFHKENTPSFTVNDSKGFYHCFGCNAGGDVIAFLQNYLSISFSEAVSELCLQTNTPLPKFQKEEKIKSKYSKASKKIVDSQY
jgi:DNA primase